MVLGVTVRHYNKSFDPGAGFDKATSSMADRWSHSRTPARFDSPDTPLGNSVEWLIEVLAKIIVNLISPIPRKTTYRISIPQRFKRICHQNDRFFFYVNDSPGDLLQRFLLLKGVTKVFIVIDIQRLKGVRIRIRDNIVSRSAHIQQKQRRDIPVFSLTLDVNVVIWC